MPERRDGLGFIPGWKAAQVLNDYFAGWEPDPPMATDEEFDATFDELVGNVVETCEIACQTTNEEGGFPLALSAKEGERRRADAPTLTQAKSDAEMQRRIEAGIADTVEALNGKVAPAFDQQLVGKQLEVREGIGSTGRWLTAGR